ncbi:site-specific integrase [Actinomadura sp. NPDC049382]|uniref:site-specific integrase n=1 Tax=Actinomadura sp. NPDC049382 TaxID=3158220 RepID=UPI00342AFAD1
MRGRACAAGDRRPRHTPRPRGRRAAPTARASPPPDQAKDLLKSVESNRYGGAITIALAYGLRRGEVLGLRWQNLDWEAGTLRLTHAVKRIKERDKSSARKTRVVLSELKTAKARLALGEAWQDHGLVFPSEVGTPTDPDNFSHTFSKLAKRAGLGHWHPHELRHSGASLMLAQGTPLHVVSEILGHAGIAITKDTYGHLVVDDKRAAAEAMSGALFGG